MNHPIRSRPVLVIAIIAALAFVILLWPRSPQQQSEGLSKATKEQTQDTGAPRLPANRGLAKNPFATQQKAPPTIARSVPADSATASRAEDLRGAVEAQNVPVVFWGKVVDQDNAPLTGVKVRASVRSWHVVTSPMGDANFDRKEVASGSDGQFMIDGGQGDSLMIEALEKEGYEPEPKALRGFGYTTSDKFTPDPSSPVVLRMWKTERKAQLVSGSKHCSMVPDGRIYTLDLMRGTLTDSPTAEGDLRIAIKRDGDAAWGKQYGWSLSILPIGGGLVEEIDGQSAMFQAPQEGYTNAYALEVLATEPEWSYASGKKRFYLKTRDGQNHARVEIEAFAYYLQDKQARLNINYAVNPSGERLLR